MPRQATTFSADMLRLSVLLARSSDLPSADLWRGMAEAVSAARSLATLNTAACNRELSALEHKRQATLERRLNDFAASVGATAELTGDPSYPVKLHLSGGETNSFSGEGYVII